MNRFNYYFILLTLKTYIINVCYAQDHNVTIDLNSDLVENGWTTSCNYFYNPQDMKICSSEFYDESNFGFWSTCDTLTGTCNLIYTVTENNPLPKSIQIEAYMRCSGSCSDRIIQIKFRPTNGDSIDPRRIPPFEGWNNIYLENLDQSLEDIGSTIIIAITAYDPQFVMIDKIIQTFDSTSTTILTTKDSPISTEQYNTISTTVHETPTTILTTKDSDIQTISTTTTEESPIHPPIFCNLKKVSTINFPPPCVVEIQCSNLVTPILIDDCSFLGLL